jgi:glycosyltransferase involved in cell wall biosynthesis
MLYINLMTGNHGIGTVGRNLTRALSRLTEVETVTEQTATSDPLPGCLLERFNRYQPSFAATRRVAYIVFERDLLMRRADMKERCGYDVLVPASQWCEEALRATGFPRITTVFHGVDRTHFCPERAIRLPRHDRFIIFSGGKFEFRKAQDVVIKAFKIFSDRHEDALLVAAWHNPAHIHAATMVASPHVRFSLGPSEAVSQAVLRCVIEAGVDRHRVTLLPALPHPLLAAIYANSDVGLFPNRCEGATNLVMMEYMSCGRPVVATNFSGHRDILTNANSLRLTRWLPLRLTENGREVASWCEPDLDEVLAQLEAAYSNRSALNQIGMQAALDLAEWTWERAAKRFLDILEIRYA